jgi:hypothetical protein
VSGAPPLLSVVVPTRNRADYARSCLRSLAAIAGELEIVVQDNSSSDELGKWLAVELADARVRYEHLPGRLSVIENCDAAMARARGEFVTLLGDDDSMLPDALAAAAWAADHGVDAVTPAKVAVYHWPDLRYRYYGDRYAGTVSVRRFSGRALARDVEAGVRRFVRGACQSIVDSTTMPKLYYGLVRRDRLSSLRSAAGTWFPGVSPDVAVAVGVSAYVRRLWTVDYPLFLPGSSAASTAGASARKQHIGRLEDQPHLPSDARERWPAQVPPFFAVQTVWAQSGLQALAATNREDLARHFGVARLHGFTAVLNPGYFAATVRHYFGFALPALRRRTLPGAVALAGGVAAAWGLRAGSLARRAATVIDPSLVTTIRGLEEVAVAQARTVDLVRELGWTFTPDGPVRRTAPARPP